VLDKALHNDKSNDSGVKAFQKLLVHTVRKCDYSAQETCHLLLQISFYHCGQNFVSLNLNKEANRLLCDNDNNMNRKDNKIKKIDHLPLQKYCN